MPACVMQSDPVECAAAALATVLRHYRRPVNVAQLRELTLCTREGASMLNLVRAARQLGFACEAVRTDYDRLREFPLPGIAHVLTKEGAGHFIVLHRVTRDRIVAADPGKGIVRLARDEFARQWSGYVAALAPTVGLRDLRTRSTLQRLGLLLRPNARVLGEAFLCSLFVLLLTVATTLYLGYLVDHVLASRRGSVLDVLSVGALAMAVFASLFRLFRSYLLAHLARKLDFGILSGLARHVLELPMRFFAARRAGDISSRFGDVARIKDALTESVIGGSIDLLTLLCAIALAFSYSAAIGTVLLALAALLMAAFAAHQRFIVARSRRVMEHSSDLLGQVVEDIHGVETLKACRATAARVSQQERKLLSTVDAVFAAQMGMMSAQFCGMLVYSVSGVGILWVGGHLVMGGALSTGQLMLLYALAAYVLQPAQNVATMSRSLQEACVAVDRVCEIAELDPEADPAREAGKAALGRIGRGIVFEGVSFGYGGDRVLEQLDLEIPAGASLAIVGASGCGKSTLCKLLARFYEPERGRILIDGIDVRDYSIDSVRARIGYVGQEPFLATGTILDNLTLGCPGIPFERVVRVARVVGLNDFVESLPERYGTRIGERGQNLSGGQRQRIALARVLLRAPEVLILDEATSQLDARSEAEIHDGLRRFLSGKTLVIVSHRLGAVRQAGRIAVFSAGGIAEVGRHEELVWKSGEYCALFGLDRKDVYVIPE